MYNNYFNKLSEDVPFYLIMCYVIILINIPIVHSNLLFYIIIIPIVHINLLFRDACLCDISLTHTARGLTLVVRI